VIVWGLLNDGLAQREERGERRVIYYASCLGGSTMEYPLL
jgi:hypothetical protein